MAVKHSSYNNIETIELSNTDVMIADKLLRMQLTNIRKAKHISQKDLSRICGLSESTISSIETPSGDSSPTLRSLTRYALGVGAEIDIRIVDKDIQDE